MIHGATGNDALTFDISESDTKRGDVEERLWLLGKAAGAKVDLSVSVQYLGDRDIAAEEANPLSGGQRPVIQCAQLFVALPNGGRAFDGHSLEDVFREAEQFVRSLEGK
jgi:hypothetical protein